MEKKRKMKKKQKKRPTATEIQLRMYFSILLMFLVIQRLFVNPLTV